MNETLPALRRASFLIEDRTERLAAIRRILEEERHRIEIAFRAYPHGTSTGLAITNLTDLIIRTHYEARRNRTAAASEISLIAVGGTGRREMCPQSDVDLLILVPDKASREVLDEAESILYLLWDLGFSVGQSVRTVKDAAKAAEIDVETYTSFLQERLIAGNFTRYREFVDTVLARPSSHRQRELMMQKLEERRKRLSSQGDLAQMLEPNIKEGRGCLRDLHTLVWLAGIQYGAHGLDELARTGIILPEDVDDAREANEFLLRTRIGLHYIAGHETDLLDFSSQTDVAEILGYENRDGVPAVEQFQRDFYRHVRVVDTLTTSYVNKISKVETHRKSRQPKDTRFHLKGGFLELPIKGVNPFLGCMELVLDLISAAQDANAPVDRLTHWYVKEALSIMRPEEVDRKKLLPKLLAISQHPHNSTIGLRDLHRIGALKLIIPDFARIDCHSQHDVYHVYTTDEHTLTVLERFTQLEASKDPLLGYLQDEYAKVKDRDMLHLAALFHDIGKGVPGNHPDTGADMVLRYAREAGWSEARASQTADLVRYHLLLNYIAQRRDLDDDKTIRDLLAVINDENQLRKLFVLTWADISSVHPDAWNDWKAHLLYKLYAEAQSELSGEASQKPDSATRRKLLISSLPEEVQTEALEHLTRLPRRYASQVSAPQVVDHLRLIHSLGSGRSVAVQVNDLGSHYEVAVASADRPGLLARICAGISLTHLSIATAQVYTRMDGVVLDLFSVMSLGAHHSAIELVTLLEQSIAEFRSLDDEEVHARMRAYVERWNSSFRRIMIPDVQVSFNDHASDDHSVLDITAPDRLGLMFSVASFFAAHGWVIHTARVLTEADSAIDSFYLVREDGSLLPSGRERTEAGRQLKKLLEVRK